MQYVPSVRAVHRVSRKLKASVEGCAAQGDPGFWSGGGGGSTIRGDWARGGEEFLKKWVS